MSRYSAILALRGSIAKSVAKTKPDKPINVDGRIKKLIRSVFYKNTPAGYSTVVRIKNAARRAALKTQVLIRAFDLPAPKRSFSLSGISVTYFKTVTIQDITKQGRLH